MSRRNADRRYLTAEEEHALAVAAQRGDQKAKAELFANHQPLVRWLSKKFSGAELEDQFSAACEGWLHALRTWKPQGGSGFRAWLTFWVRAYVGRLTEYARWDANHIQSLETKMRGKDGDPLEIDPGDEGFGADEMVDELWRRQARGIIDGMPNRREVIVLQERMRGTGLEEIATRRGRELNLVSGKGGRESVRKLEAAALRRAKVLAQHARRAVA